jgi:PAS domain S-box-containing protein
MGSRPRRRTSSPGRRAEPDRTQPDLAAAIVAGSPDAILVVSLARRILQANESAAQLFAREQSELVGAAIDDLIAPAERPAVVVHERQAHRGTAQRFETRIRPAEGEERVAAVVMAPLHDGGELVGVAVTLRDITEEFIAHETLARSEARYRHLFEGATDAILTLNDEACFTTINYAGEVISGYGRDELVGNSFAPLIAPEALERTFYEFQRALAGEKGQFETLVVRKDGEVRSIAVTRSCVQPGVEVLCIARDVTEQKQLQQQLIQSEKMGAIGQLVSGVAHELNNPLASIAAFAQLVLADQSLPAQHRHSAEIIAGESRRAARIVSNLLTFARQHKAEKVPADINKVLEDTLELRSYELSVRGISIVRDYDPRLPETMADIYQLQQVFLNLVTNAEHAMVATERTHHRLTVRTRAVPNAIRVELEDTGHGIPADSLQRIFNPFYTTKPTGKGTGLGLSISLGIVSEHGGRIWAENVHGGGSRFCVELPHVEPVRKSGTVRQVMDAAPSSALRILVVDDEDALRLAIELWLKQSGHEVVSTGSGSDALARMLLEPFDAILLDIRMPDMSGQQIFVRLKKERPALIDRIIFLTGDTVSVDLRRFLDDSGRPFLAKPFDFNEIMQVLPKRSIVR